MPLLKTTTQTARRCCRVLAGEQLLQKARWSPAPSLVTTSLRCPARALQSPFYRAPAAFALPLTGAFLVLAVAIVFALALVFLFLASSAAFVYWFGIVLTSRLKN